MFKNCVFNPSVNTKKWFKKAGIRAVKTMAQTFVGTIGASSLMSQVDWAVVCSATVLSGIVSFATSIAGIPEAEAEEDETETKTE